MRVAFVGDLSGFEVGVSRSFHINRFIDVLIAIHQVGTGYFLANERNLARLPYYSRVDVRLSKAFLFRNWKLTLTGEVLNVLNRENLRYAGFFSFGSDGRVFGGLDRVLPILPSAGVVIEF